MNNREKNNKNGILNRKGKKHTQRMMNISRKKKRKRYKYYKYKKYIYIH